MSKADLGDLVRSFMKEHLDKDACRYLLADEAPPYGVPIPLPLQWLLDANVLILQRIYGLAGFEQTQKTGFALELVRLMRAGNSGDGEGGYVENEGGKYNKKYVEAVLRDSDYRAWFAPILGSESLQDAQRACTMLVMYRRTEECLKQQRPFGIVLDSLTGQDVSEFAEEMEESGHASRQHPVGALLWSSWFKVFSGKLQHAGPTAFFFVNHLKEKQASMPGRPPTKTQPGGRAPKFHAAVMLVMSFLGKETTTTAMDHEGKKFKQVRLIRHLQIECIKNSMGTYDRHIEVPFVKYWEQPEGEPTVDDRGKEAKQILYFDWDAATARLVCDLQADHKLGADVERMREICDVTSASELYSSKMLGLEGVRDYVLGAAINRDPVMVDKLSLAMRIQQFPVWGRDVEAVKRSRTKPLKQEELEELRDSAKQADTNTRRRRKRQED